MTITLADLRRERLAELGREPFTDQLAEWLQHWSDALSPAEAHKHLQAWMLKHPDRAAQAQAIFARLAGYTEKLEIRTGQTLDAMSDVELEHEVARRFGLTPDGLRALTAKPVIQISNASAKPATENTCEGEITRESGRECVES